MKLTLVLVMVIVSLAVACGSNEEEPMQTPTPPTGGPDPMIVQTLAGRPEPASNISVVGYLVISTKGARLCDALLESYPPQCGHVSVEIAGYESLGINFEEAEGVSWTNNKVSFRGTWQDSVFTATGLLE